MQAGGVCGQGPWLPCSLIIFLHTPQPHNRGLRAMMPLLGGSQPCGVIWPTSWATVGSSVGGGGRGSDPSLPHPPRIQSRLSSPLRLSQGLFFAFLKIRFYPCFAQAPLLEWPTPISKESSSVLLACIKCLPASPCLHSEPTSTHLLPGCSAQPHWRPASGPLNTPFPCQEKWPLPISNSVTPPLHFDLSSDISKGPFTLLSSQHTRTSEVVLTRKKFTIWKSTTILCLPRTEVSGKTTAPELQRQREDNREPQMTGAETPLRTSAETGVSEL